MSYPTKIDLCNKLKELKDIFQQCKIAIENICGYGWICNQSIGATAPLNLFIKQELSLDQLTKLKQALEELFKEKVEIATSQTLKSQTELIYDIKFKLLPETITSIESSLVPLSKIIEDGERELKKADYLEKNIKHANFPQEIINLPISKFSEPQKKVLFELGFIYYEVSEHINLGNDIITYLQRNESIKNIVEYARNWSIHFACANKNSDLVEEIIRVNPEYINLKEKRFGNTPLHISLLKDDKETVNILLKKGADIKTSNKKGVTCKELLEKKGYNVNNLVTNAKTTETSLPPTIDKEKGTLIKCIQQRRKILLISNIEIGSQASEATHKELSELASLDKILYGVEGYYWDSDFKDKNCYGLEDPFIHRFVCALEAANYILTGDLSNGFQKDFPPFAKKSTIETIKGYDVIFKKDLDFKKFRLDEFAVLRIFVQLSFLLYHKLFQKYSFDPSNIGLDYSFTNGQLTSYVANLLANLYYYTKIYKYELRHTIFTYYAKKILSRDSHLHLVMLVDNEYLSFLKSKLEKAVPECEVKIIEARKLKNEIGMTSISTNKESYTQRNEATLLGFGLGFILAMTIFNSKNQSSSMENKDKPHFFLPPSDGSKKSPSTKKNM